MRPASTLAVGEQHLGTRILGENVFQPTEIAAVAAFCADLPLDRRWVRRRGPAGQDIIEIEVERSGSVKLMKVNGAYAVTGLGGWGLAIFEDLSAVIDALEKRRLRPGRERPLALGQR